MTACGVSLADARELHAAGRGEALLRQADAAYAAGERDRARRLYRAVLAADEDNSRAVFQLGRLAPPGSEESIQLFARYVALEPQDPWGYMALGDALAAAGAVDRALEQYAHARRRAPKEADVYVGRGRILRGTGGSDELIANYEQWSAQQPGNRTAWLELAEARRRAQRFAEAVRAYDRALALQPDEPTARRRDAALAENAFSVRPFTGRGVDSDDNRITRLGLQAEWQLADRARAGLHIEQAKVTDPIASGSAQEFAFAGNWRPRVSFGVDGLIGTARLDSNQAGRATTRHPLMRLRARWRSPQDGPGADLRLTRQPLIATPGLIALPVELEELKGGLDLPLGGRLRGIVRGQRGTLDAASEVNRRTGFQIGPAVRWQPGAQIGLSYRTLGYAHDTVAGYFAPRRVDAFELSAYLEAERWPLSLALDVGAGEQRVARQGEPRGGWVGAFRLWAWLSWELNPGVRLGLEIEHDDSPVGAVAATPASDWSFNSVMLSLRFGVESRPARATRVLGAGS